MEKMPIAYLLASGRNRTLYVGVTSDLAGRVWQHREHVADGFSKRYDVTRLAWYEMHPTMDSAILREKRIKKWKRALEDSIDRRSESVMARSLPDIAGQVPGVTSMDSRLRGNDDQER
jgi:putative endonuclease